MNARITSLAATLAGALALPTASLFAQATNGWLQTTYGPWDYNQATNWAGGVINGRWDESLTLTQAQNVTFAGDQTLSYPLYFGYAGSYDLRLQGSGGDRTLTLGGDITHATALNKTVNIGNDPGAGLPINLGGVPRVFNVLSGHVLKLYSAISNGSLKLSGGGIITLNSDNAAAAGVAILTDLATTLEFLSSGTGATRASAVTLQSSFLKVTGNSAAHSSETISGDLTAAAASAAGGYSASIITLAPNSGRNARLMADRLVRSGDGTLLFRGTNLGTYTIASQTANSANIQFATTPTLTGGGGAADTATISILPGAIGGTSTSDGGSTFVTYTTENGLRPLNTATEFATNITDGTVTADNVRLSGTNVLVTINSATTINSLIVNPAATVATSVDGAGTLTVTSGQLLLNPANMNMTTTINAPLNFGNARGVIGSSYNRLVEIKGAISGSGGLTFYQVPSAAPSTQFSARFNTGSTYTGDTIVLGRLEVGSTFLPYGSRTGDVYVHGYMRLNQSSYNGTINGLFGNGLVQYGNSGASSLTIGDNDATSTFSGTLSGNASLSLTKIGSGTVTLSGSCTHTAATSVNGGTLIVDGGFLSAITVKTNAMLRGKGTIDKAGTAITVNNGGTLAPGDADGAGTLRILQGDVAFASGALLTVKAGSAGACLLEVAGSVTGTATNAVTVQGAASDTGSWMVMKAAAITPVFTSATAGVIVTKENGATELWVRRLPKGTLISIS